MQVSKLIREKLACAYFFMAPALVYGIFTSRLPALKSAVGMNDSQTGALLLALGIATVIGLTVCGCVIDRIGAKKITGISALFMVASIILAGASSGIWMMGFFCFATGIAVGFCDVAMNAQGIYIEKCHNSLCLSFLHGCSSLGGVVGAISGSVCAYLGLSPFLNLLAVLGLFLCLWPAAYGNMSNFMDEAANKKEKFKWSRISFAVYACGILSLLCHVAEGSAGEWGSLLLHGIKGATQGEAALVFAAFTGAMVICRMAADNLRRHVHDVTLLFWGSMLGACGMSLALLSPWPLICLAGYAIMGAGLAPVAPILFSVAGATPGVSPGQASGLVSVLSYAGLLVFPPFIGMLGDYAGLQNTLWIIAAICVCVAFGSLGLKKYAAHGN